MQAKLECNKINFYWFWNQVHQQKVPTWRTGVSTAMKPWDSTELRISETIYRNEVNISVMMLTKKIFAGKKGKVLHSQHTQNLKHSQLKVKCQQVPRGTHHQSLFEFRLWQNTLKWKGCQQKVKNWLTDI